MNTSNTALTQSNSAYVRNKFINPQIKDYAETAMNELLSWYGYNRTTSELNVDFHSLNSSSLPISINRRTNNTRAEKQSLTIQEDKFSTEVSFSASSSSSSFSPPLTSPTSFFPKTSTSVPSTSNFSEMSFSPLNSNSDQESMELSKLIHKPFPNKNNSSCLWCKATSSTQNLTLKGTNNDESFCSETCYSQYRRATIHNSKKCDWCQHIRSSVNCVDLQDGNTQYKFCSDRCLNQFKLDIFCKETKEHLDIHPYHREQMLTANDTTSSLITPDMWLKNCPESNELDSLTLNEKSPESLPSDTSYMTHIKNITNYKEVSTRRNSRKSLKKKRRSYNLHTPLIHERQKSENAFKNMESESSTAAFQLSSSTLPRVSRVPNKNHSIDMNSPDSGVKSIKSGLNNLPLPPLLPINVLESSSVHRSTNTGSNTLSTTESISTSSRTSLIPPPTVLIPYPILFPLILPIPIPIPIPIPATHLAKSNKEDAIEDDNPKDSNKQEGNTVQ